MEKYINDELVIKDVIYNTFKELITCPLCFNILIDQMMCMNCQNVYCKKCIDQWKEKDNKCPNRCENPNYQRSLGKKDILSKLKFKCLNCENEIEYEKIQSHYNSCPDKNNLRKKMKKKKSLFHRLSSEESSKLKKEGKDIIYITLITLGCSGVGKTSLIQTFINQKSTLIQINTIGLPHYFNTYKLSDGSLINVKIMDTAGQERFKALNTQYYRGADCCLLVYDITYQKSFEEIKNYYNQEIKDKCPKYVKVILLGNKTDLENERTISSEEASELALENNYIFMETSCLEDNNVADAFETLIENTYRETIINGRGKKNLNENICHEKTIIQKSQCKC